MLFDSLFLLFSLGSERGRAVSAAKQVEQWKNDEDRQRREFLEEHRRWQKDKFCFCADVGSNLGNEYSQRIILEKLKLIEAGYSPYGEIVNIQDASPYSLWLRAKQFEHKLVRDTPSSPFVHFHVKLTDMEAFIENEYKFTGVNPYHSLDTAKISPEIRSLWKERKVTIGIPMLSEGYGLCQIMTTNEARIFMDNVLEERFQKYWKSVKK